MSGSMRTMDMKWRIAPTSAMRNAAKNAMRNTPERNAAKSITKNMPERKTTIMTATTVSTKITGTTIIQLNPMETETGTTEITEMKTTAMTAMATKVTTIKVMAIKTITATMAIAIAKA